MLLALLQRASDILGVASEYPEGSIGYEYDRRITACNRALALPFSRDRKDTIREQRERLVASRKRMHNVQDQFIRDRFPCTRRIHAAHLADADEEE